MADSPTNVAPSHPDDAGEDFLPRPALEELQRRKLAAMLEVVLARNGFYRRKLAGVRFDPLADPLERLPFTTRAELEQDQLDHPPYGSNLTYPVENYCRLHQTSGSKGRPLRCLDTAQSWGWWKQCWGTVFRAAGVCQGDRLIFPFSFGPFIGFWSAFEAASAAGFLCLPAGGMTTAHRLRFLLDNAATVICCTPTYALHLAEAAGQQGIDLAGSAVRRIIVAGEPGGHVAATRRRIEFAWGARLIDHTGATEVGALGFECEPNPGDVHLMEHQAIIEVINPTTGGTAGEGEAGELVVTNLGRWGYPVIRYRTGDQVRVVRDCCACGRWLARMRGGILGRMDDMFIVRGNNVFPTALEGIVRQFAEVAEFTVEVDSRGPLAEVVLSIEPTPDAEGQNLGERVGRAIQDALAFRAEVRVVAVGSLPRYEMKARRFTRRT